MLEWSDVDLAVRDAVREFVDKEIRPHVDALESGEMEPYPIIRKLFATFGIDRHGPRFAEQATGPAARRRRVVRRSRRSRRHVRRRRRRRHGLRRGQRTVPGVDGRRHRDGRQPRPDGADDHGPRHARPAGALAARSGHLREDRRVGDHRTRLGLGCVRRHEVLRRARRSTTTSSTARRRSSPTVPTPTWSSCTPSSTRATPASTSATARC